MNDLYGLVLAGGKSRRMKTDKAKLVYENKAQYIHCINLLEKFCTDTHLSLRQDQADEYKDVGINTIFDKPEYEGEGPLAGIISAMETYPDVDWLVLACDLPNVDGDVLNALCSNRDGRLIVAYKSVTDQLPEPLCAIYSRESVTLLKEEFEQGGRCPRKILIKNKIPLLNPIGEDKLDNINNQEEYMKHRETNK